MNMLSKNISTESLESFIYYRNKYEIDCISGGMKVEVKAGKPYRKCPKGVVILEEKDIPEFLIKIFE